MIARKLLLLFLSLALLACQGTEADLATSTPKSRPTATPAPTRTPKVESKLGVPVDDLDGLVVDVWHPWYGAPASLFEDQIAEFNEINPWRIQVRLTSQQNYTELFSLASAAVHGPNRPDVVIGLPEYAIEWQEQEAVLDLNPYVSDPVYGLSGSQIADFPAVFWAQDQVGGVRLGIPAQRTARFLLYNQTWAKELGFDDSPGSANEFKQQACKANKSMLSDEDPTNDGKGGWLIDAHPITNLSWLLAFGGGAQESEGFRFLRPENITATRFIKGMSEEGCAWRTQDPDHLKAFVERTSLFATASMEELPELSRDFARAGSSDQWTVLPFPGSESNALVVYGASYILFTSEEADQLAAWLLVRWLLEPENQVDWVTTAGLFPLQTATMSYLDDYAGGHPQWEQAVRLLPQARTTPQLAAWRTVRVALGDGFNFMFRVDTPTGQVPAILAQLDAIVTDLHP